MTELTTVSLRVPRLLRDRMVSLTANNPDDYFSTTEAWIKAAEEYLLQHEKVRI